LLSLAHGKLNKGKFHRQELLVFLLLMAQYNMLQ